MAETDRAFTHPNFGKEVRIERDGKEVRLVFVADGIPQAESLVRSLLRQLRDGALNLTLMGKPTRIEED